MPTNATPAAAIADLLAGPPQLFRMAYRFNCQPALDIHPDHLADLIAPTQLATIASSRRGERELSSFISKRFELGQPGWWDVSDVGMRLALLDRPRLTRLVRMLGAAVLCHPIARVIAKEPLRQLKSALGGSLYEFAVKRAPFLVGSAAEDGGTSLTADPSRRVTEQGVRCLASCWVGAPRALTERVALKLSPEAELEDQAAPSRESMLRLAIRLLSREVAPELKPCFT